ncbi:MAG: DUF5683 domain-containing protein [Chitinophagaceae bacterium]
MSRFLILIIFVCSCPFCFAQQKKDTVIVRNDSILTVKKKSDTSGSVASDTLARKKHSPRKAAIRSAILPGWGQAYNRKYWKMPIVYGALGTTAYVFNFNLTQYKRIGKAYNILVKKDTLRYKEVDADLQPFITQNASSSLRSYRNEYRRNIDYSVLVFILFWGLNVVDATVDAHLKGFDVSEDLSLKIKPGYNPGSNTTGLSLVVDIHKRKSRLLGLP